MAGQTSRLRRHGFASMSDAIDLSMDDPRAVTACAAASAAGVLLLFTQHHPTDSRPGAAIAAALASAAGGARGKFLRHVSWAALKAATQTDIPAAAHAARSALAARATELAANDRTGEVGASHILAAAERATPEMGAIRRLHPAAAKSGR